MRISATQRAENHNRVRVAMDRLLRGEIPPGGNCDENTVLRQRLAERDQAIAELATFKTRALSQLAAQHDELTRLRRQPEHSGRVRYLPNRAPATEPRG